jgi:alpha-beta hydrolase superfamily lysophospholipase
MRVMDNSLLTADGLKLHFQHWPASQAARGTVLVAHGLGEHIGRYAALAARLNATGWHVAGHDQRGHGRSEGARGALPRHDALLHDLARVVDAVRTALPGPLVLLGHSMGGLVAARFVAEGTQPKLRRAAWSRDVDALVLSSPALDAGMSAAQKLLLAVLGRLAPNLALHNGLQPEWISRDAAVVAAYKADPLVHDRITPRLARFIVDSGKVIAQRAGAWRLPTLLMWAGADRCVAPSGSRDFAVAAPRVLVQTQDFGPLYHEIFNEPEKEEVYALLGRWLALRGR